MEEEYLADQIVSKTDEENLRPARDLEEILRGKDGVQSYLNSKIQNNNYRQTVSWETYLSKYIRFRKNTAKIVEEEEEEGDVSDGSSVHNFNQKYNFFVPDSKFGPVSQGERFDWPLCLIFRSIWTVIFPLKLFLQTIIIGRNSFLP